MQTAMQPQGVQAAIERVNTKGAMIYQETSKGLELIEQSNVDIANELTDMIVNANYYKANLKTIQTSENMLASLLDIKA